MKTLPLFLLCSLLVLPASAAPVDLGNLKLRDGRELVGVKVRKIEPDGLRIEHRDGVGKIRLEELPADVAQRFSLDEESASAWRDEEKKRQDEAAQSQRSASVRSLMQLSRAAQDTQARSQRLSIFDQSKATNLNYAALDEQLLAHIQTWKDAGREDLAQRFEEDRQLFKQQEINRPSGQAQVERDALARRVQSLQNEVAAARSQPTTTTVVVNSDPYLSNSRSRYYYPDLYRPTYVTPTYYPTYPVPYCPPTVVRPPVTVRPPQVVTPQRPMNQGNPIHGSHLWKK